MAIIPIYTRPPLLPGEAPIFGLTADDAMKVQMGYGCPNCLEDFQGIYLAVCPVCQHERNVEEDFVAPPPGWVEHLRESMS